jgi:hypothetical protein
MKGTPEVRRFLKYLAPLNASMDAADGRACSSLNPGQSATRRAVLVSRQMFLRFLRHKRVQMSEICDSEQPLEQSAEHPIAQIEELFDQFAWGHETTAEKTYGQRPVLTPSHFADIFEQSCQQRKNGTFYTPADVTEYIVVNTILPHVITVIERLCLCTKDSSTRTGQPPIFDNVPSALKHIKPWITRIGDLSTLEQIWHVLDTMHILDPTCGAGAFLVSALKLLRGLRMNLIEQGQRLVMAECHPRQWRNPELQTFVTSNIESRDVSAELTKQILERNLFGVDLLPEAAEVCRMRLLLDLAGVAKDGSTLAMEPSFSAHIQAGNAFVGYNDPKSMPCDIDMSHVTARHLLREEIDRRYWEDKAVKHSTLHCEDFDQWKASHRPFHFPWMFPETIARGGFDVVVGNPPFLEISELKGSYELPRTNVAAAGNLYAVCIERGSSLLAPHGRLGMIVPMSSVSTPRMEPLMVHLEERFGEVAVANFAVRPGKIFDGVDMNVSTILAAGRRVENLPVNLMTTDYVRWNEKDRVQLFANLKYHATYFDKGRQTVPKTGSRQAHEILQRLTRFAPLREILGTQQGGVTLFYHSGGRYFRKCLRKKLSKEYKPLHVPLGAADSVLCLLSSSIFYWYWITISDCYHVTRRDVYQMPFPKTMLADGRFSQLAESLLADLEKHAICRERLRADGSRQSEYNYRMASSRTILDAIDTTLAEHYGLSSKQLNWVLQCDRKYRSSRRASQALESDQLKTANPTDLPVPS